MIPRHPIDYDHYRARAQMERAIAIAALCRWMRTAVFGNRFNFAPRQKMPRLVMTEAR
jgi:hypothetical protein